jgi:hypothetical protein
VTAGGKVYRYEIVRNGDGRVSEWSSFKMPENTLSGHVKLLDSTTVTVDGEQIWIPTAVSVSGVGGGGKVWIDEASLMVNGDVDLDVFTLSHAAAKYVQTDEVSTGPITRARQLAVVEQRSSSLVVVLGIGLVVLAAIGCWWRLRST